MRQLELFYLNINYCGFRDDYYFSGVQEGFRSVPDFVLYTGRVHRATLSSDTLDGLIRGDIDGEFGRCLL